ncbi:MAG: potassium channel protein [Verrucomicrobia bacterium]|nr:MAG: potassium channel protein [Verrucomicrobiota bacterium]
MKLLPAVVSYFLQNPTRRKNLMVLVRLVAILLILLVVYAVIFHILMAAEGQEHTWFTGFYWALTVMSTLGFGDITFHTDAGRFFSMVVLITGMVFLLIILPFTFIQFAYAPWIEAQQAAATPSQLPEHTRNHVVITNWDHVTSNLTRKLKSYGYEYAVIVPTLDRAREMNEMGVRVVLGEIDSPETYRAVRLEKAAMLAATGSDTANTNAAFTAREIAPHIRIVAKASRHASEEILKLAGVDHVIQLPEMLGQSLARRCNPGRHVANLIGEVDEIAIAEAPVAGTPLVGQTLAESRLRERTGLSAIGLWDRGTFRPATPDIPLSANTVLVLAGSKGQLAAFNERFARPENDAPVIIIGGGRVGRATGHALMSRGIDYCIIERNRDEILDTAHFIHGDASHRKVLEEAGIHDTPAVILTTHEDDTNVYLAIFIRRLRPDIQLIGRANLERNISTLHRAGVDFVMSYAGMGANTMLNILRGGNLLMVAEGLALFKLPVPPSLCHVALADSRIRAETGCSVVGVRRADATMVNPDPTLVFQAGDELLLIGDVEAERTFLSRYPQNNTVA